MKKILYQFTLPYNGKERKPEFIKCNAPWPMRIVAIKAEPNVSEIKFLKTMFDGAELPDNSVNLNILCEIQTKNDGTYDKQELEFMIVPERCSFDTKPEFSKWLSDRIDKIPLEERNCFIQPQSREEYEFVGCHVVDSSDSISLYMKVYEFSPFDLNK